MHYIPDNLRFLRKQKGWTQGQFAHQLGVKRSLIGAYEEGRADPRISFLLLICQKFDLSMDQLVSAPLSKGIGTETKFSGSNLRILPIAIDKLSNNEKATLVPVHASAGYLNGYGDIEFIESLPIFDLPYTEVSKGKTYRIFQIKGESMLPILPGSYIIGSYIMDWNNIKNDQLYIVISKTEGIVFKRVLNNLKDQMLTLKSDNPEFETYSIQADDVLEVWKAEGMTTFELNGQINPSQQQILNELRTIKTELNSLKERFNT